MKKFLSGFLVVCFLSAFGSYASIGEEPEYYTDCSRMADQWAEIARFHQEGIPLDLVLHQFKDEHQAVRIEIIKIYSSPQFTAPEVQERTIARYRAKVLLECEMAR